MDSRDKLEEFVDRIATYFYPAAKSSTVRNVDDSVDAQVIVNVGQYSDSERTLTAIMDVIRSEHLRALLPKGAMIGSGVIYNRTVEEVNQYLARQKKKGEVDPTPVGEQIGRGLAQANSSYFFKQDLAESEEVTKVWIIDKIREAGYEEPHQVFIRVYWHPEKKHPARKRRTRRLAR